MLLQLSEIDPSLLLFCEATNLAGLLMLTINYVSVATILEIMVECFQNYLTVIIGRLKYRHTSCITI